MTISNKVIDRNNSPGCFSFKYPSETESITRFSLIEDKCGTCDFCFYQWFVGYTDGDGCFSIYVNNITNKINLTYKLSQSSNNIQVLHFMKKRLGVGHIRSDKLGMSHYLIRDKVSLYKIIIPLFNHFSLKTSKYVDFLKFKHSLFIYLNDSLTQKNKISLIENIKNSDIYNKELNRIINLTKSWIVGFIEAEGSFYLVEKEKNKRIVHGFGLTLKKDLVVLEELRSILQIKATIRWNNNGFYSLDSTNYLDLKFIKNFFFKTMKSRKSLIYRLWARSFRDRGKYSKLKTIKSSLNRMKV